MIKKLALVNNVIAPLALGTLCFMVVIGPTILNPANIEWLRNADPLVHYLGWENFRISKWLMPPGLNPQYGLDIPSSILSTDSIPLLSIFFKVFSEFLPEQFQFFGMWIFLSFILQGYFAYKLIGLFQRDHLSRMLGAFLIIFAPPFLARVGMHITLAGHFFILCALYLNLQEKLRHPTIYWMLLIGVSTAVHPYFLIMVGFLFVAYLCDRIYIKRTLSHRLAALKLLTALGLTLLLGWLTGYFVMQGSGAYGFGIYKANILTLVDPDQYSYILPNIKTNTFDNGEGFNYLGLGLISLIPWLAIHPKNSIAACVSFANKRPFLLAAILCFAIFSLSNSIGIGPWELSLPMPDWLLKLASTFRATGRFFWPTFYFVALSIIYLATINRSKKFIHWILFLACILQIVDTSAGWIKQRIEFNVNVPTSLSQLTLKNVFWESACKRYQKLIVVPVQPSTSQYKWDILGPYALKCHMGTNSVYLARGPSASTLSKNNQDYLHRILTHQYDTDTLYIFDEWKAAPQYATPKFINGTDLLARVDGINILAPGWFNFSPKIDTSSIEVKKFSPEVAIGKFIEFNRRSDFQNYLHDIGNYDSSQGWANPEDWGAWSNGYESTLDLFVPDGDPNTIQFDFRALVTPSHPQQRLTIYINGIKLPTQTLTHPESNLIKLALLPGQKVLHIRLLHPDAISPAELGIGQDNRKLAIGIKNVIFQ